jgi:hypothetical protein
VNAVVAKLASLAPEHRPAGLWGIRAALIERTLALFPIRSTWHAHEVNKLLRGRLTVRIEGDRCELVALDGQPAEPWIADQLRQPEFRRFLSRPLRGDSRR